MGKHLANFSVPPSCAKQDSRGASPQSAHLEFATAVGAFYAIRTRHLTKVGLEDWTGGCKGGQIVRQKKHRHECVKDQWAGEEMKRQTTIPQQIL